MAYTKPTPANLKARYAEFAAVPDASAQYWLTDGERFVTEAWAEGDYAPGLMAYAAHNLAVSGLGTGAALPQGVTSFRSGSFSATVTDAQASAEGFDATRYGREFIAMQRRNNGTPMLIMTGRL